MSTNRCVDRATVLWRDRPIGFMTPQDTQTLVSTLCTNGNDTPVERACPDGSGRLEVSLRPVSRQRSFSRLSLVSADGCATLTLRPNIRPQSDPSKLQIVSIVDGEVRELSLAENSAVLATAP